MGITFCKCMSHQRIENHCIESIVGFGLMTEELNIFKVDKLLILHSLLAVYRKFLRGDNNTSFTF